MEVLTLLIQKNLNTPKIRNYSKQKWTLIIQKASLIPQCSMFLFLLKKIPLDATSDLQIFYIAAMEGCMIHNS